MPPGTIDLLRFQRLCDRCRESPELVDFNEDDAVEPMVTTREPVFSYSPGHAAYADEMEEGV